MWSIAVFLLASPVCEPMLTNIIYFSSQSTLGKEGSNKVYAIHK